MLKRIKSIVRRFRRKEEGTVVVETVIMFPTLFATVLATFVFFDAFRNQSINLKAAYTISDALSRETDPITNDFMINSWRMHRFLTNAEALTKLRVTLIQYDADEDDYSVVWSQNKGGAGNLNNSGLSAMVTNEEVPVMPDGETLILVQTWVNYEPNFSIGIGGFTFENTVFTRPRSAPNGICYSHNDTFDDRICPLDS
jgi:Flp pilus assembly protein TadG